MSTTSEERRSQGRRWAVGLLAGGGATLTLGAIGLAEGFPWTGWIVADGLGVLLLCAVARHRALHHTDETGPVSRLWGGAFDERDRRVLDTALAQVGAGALMVLGIGNVLVSVGAATAAAVLPVSLVLLIVVGVVSFAVVHART